MRNSQIPYIWLQIFKVFLICGLTEVESFLLLTYAVALLIAQTFIKNAVRVGAIVSVD